MHTVITQRWATTQASATRALGVWLGQQAQAGDVVACQGVLGAGKTTFVQGFAEGVGVGAQAYVRSPTFTLLNEYQGRVPLYHFDFYRLSDISEVPGIGFEDCLEVPGVVIVEWADKFPALFNTAHLEVSIHITAASCRYVQCTAYGAPYVRYFRQAPCRL